MISHMVERAHNKRMRPAWAMPCHWFAEYMLQVENLVKLTNYGVRGVINLAEILEITMQGKQRKEEQEKALEDAKQLARLADSEIASDFPLLHSHAIIGMWGALEAMIEDLAVSWIDHNPSVLSEPTIARIRVPLAEFQGMEQADRLRFLIAELQRDLRVDLKSGATKFESLLGAIGLNGPVDKRVRNVLFETQQLRNIFAHRGGVADRRFIANCPQLNYSTGDTVKINSATFVRIYNGLTVYNLIIINRCRATDGLGPVAYEAPGFEGALTNPCEVE
jgi:hypothetical protein